MGVVRLSVTALIWAVNTRRFRIECGSATEKQVAVFRLSASV
jgi:hypothetical protein